MHVDTYRNYSGFYKLSIDSLGLPDYFKLINVECSLDTLLYPKINVD